MARKPTKEEREKERKRLERNAQRREAYAKQKRRELREARAAERERIRKNAERRERYAAKKEGERLEAERVKRKSAKSPIAGAQKAPKPAPIPAPKKETANEKIARENAEKRARNELVKARNAEVKARNEAKRLKKESDKRRKRIAEKQAELEKKIAAKAEFEKNLGQRRIEDITDDVLDAAGYGNVNGLISGISTLVELMADAELLAKFRGYDFEGYDAENRRITAYSQEEGTMYLFHTYDKENGEQRLFWASAAKAGEYTPQSFQVMYEHKNIKHLDFTFTWGSDEGDDPVYERKETG